MVEKWQFSRGLPNYFFPGEREVRGVAPAAVLPGDDVIDLEGQRGVRFGEVASGSPTEVSSSSTPQVSM